MSQDDGNGLESLLAEFVREHSAGNLPDPLTYLERAGEAAPRLREAIALFLIEAAPVTPTPAAALALRARYSPRRQLVEDLLAEFVREHSAGNLPDPLAYLERAGDAAPRLREAIALFLVEAAPVTPTPEAALALSARYSPRADPAAGETPTAEPLFSLLRWWRTGTVAVRRRLLDGVAETGFGFQLAADGIRGRDIRSDFVIPLDHPQGARAELDAKGILWIAVFGALETVVGARLLVAFPQARSDEDGLEWRSGAQDLPPGLVEAGEAEEGALRVPIGRLSDPSILERVLSEVRIVTTTDLGT